MTAHTCHDVTSAISAGQRLDEPPEEIQSSGEDGIDAYLQDARSWGSVVVRHDQSFSTLWNVMVFMAESGSSKNRAS